METSMSTIVPFNNSILEFFVFTKSGICILNSQYKNIYDKENDYNKYKIIIKNISCHLLDKATDTTLFYFSKITISSFIIQILLKDGMAFVGIFPNNSSTSFQKLILIHMYIALINFKGDIIEKVEILNRKNINFNSFETIKDFFYKNQNELNDFKLTDLFEFIIYELYFLRYIGIHFQKIYNELLKREELNQTYFKFKNLYIVDLSTGNLLLDWNALEKVKKNKKYYRNEKLWFELIHHSKMMMESYKNEHRYNFTYIGSSFRFVKFECTSSFPRLTFIIKFVPLLKGLSIIHVYSQKKLSRITENSEQQLFKYKEIDLLYGSEMKTNANFDFRYSEPRMLQHIEKFLIEFLISIRNSEIFRDENSNKELKYFNYPIILEINKISENGNNTIDEIVKKINEALKIMYISNKSNGKNYNRAASLYSRIFTDAEKLDNVLVIKKEDILKDLFNRDGIESEVESPVHQKEKKSPPVVLVRNHFLNSSQKKKKKSMDKSDTISLSQYESASNDQITINQSYEVSKISIDKKYNKIDKDEDVKSNEIQLDKLIDTNQTGRIFLEDASTERNLYLTKRNKLKIKVPNPKTEDNEMKGKKKEKLILLEDKNNTGSV
jgi:hypothetical protein